MKGSRGESIRKLDSFIAKIDQLLTLIAVRVILAGTTHGRQEKCWCSVQICILRPPRGTREQRALTWLPAVCAPPRPLQQPLRQSSWWRWIWCQLLMRAFNWAIKIMCTLSQSVGGSKYLPPSLITHSDIQMSCYKNELLLRMSPLADTLLNTLCAQLYNADCVYFYCVCPIQTRRFQPVFNQFAFIFFYDDLLYWHSMCLYINFQENN